MGRLNRTRTVGRTNRLTAEIALLSGESCADPPQLLKCGNGVATNYAPAKAGTLSICAVAPRIMAGEQVGQLVRPYRP